VIDKTGRRPHPDKINAIIQAAPPKNVSELRTFLGMINYYGSFLQNLSTKLRPLNELLRADVQWKWSRTCQKVFDDVKKELTESHVLTHYDPKKKLILACDASPYGLGVVLSHEEDGERPIAFASRSLTKAEKNYSQIEKEALGIIYGIDKFHKYLYGRQFTLVTDNDPLTHIFAPDKAVPKTAALRLTRWSLKLSAYDYDIRYKRSKDHANADYLSRSPVGEAKKNLESGVYHFSIVNELPVTADDIAKHTKQDPVLCKVMQYTLGGWPAASNISQDFAPYHARKNELSKKIAYCGE
jgi:hypothetical protein